MIVDGLEHTANSQQSMEVIEANAADTGHGSPEHVYGLRFALRPFH